MPDVILAITPTCPHCPNVMQTLNELVKQGEVGSIQVVNIAVENGFAQDNQIRSVPWLKIGTFILTGVQSKQTILDWVKKAHSAEGTQAYLVETLSGGELETTIQMLQQHPEAIEDFLPLIEDEETNINVRLGMAAIIETLEDQDILQRLVPGLLQLLRHPQARVRGDAAHFLSFMHDKNIIPALQELRGDPDADVRDIVAESLEILAMLE